MIAKYAGRGKCTIEGVTIRTPAEGYNSPVAQAIVFASLGSSTGTNSSGMNVVFLASCKLCSLCHTCLYQKCYTECDSSIHIVHAGVPSLEKLVSFDQVRSEHDFEQEVVRWSQQVGRLCTVSSVYMVITANLLFAYTMQQIKLQYRRK